MGQLNKKRISARPSLSKHVGDGMFELRSKYKDGITRIFYFFIDGDRIVLTNAYTKKQQELSSFEFNRAKKYRDDFYKQENR